LQFVRSSFHYVKKIFAIISAAVFISFLHGNVLAQSSIDSLIKQIEKQHDTTKIKILTDYCWTNRNKKPREALEAGEKALRLANSLTDTKSIAKVYNLIGVVYRNLGHYDKAIGSYKNALKISETAKDSIQIAYSNNNIGGLYRLEGNNTLALEYILRALKIFENRKNKTGIAFCTINIGLIYRRQQNFTKALEYLNYTLKLREEINDRQGKALALNLIAEILFERGDINSALKYYLEVEKEYSAVDDKKGLAATWGGIGGVYYVQKDYTRALEYRTKALELSNKINYLEGKIANNSKIGLVYARLGNYSKAEENLSNALKLAQNVQEINSKIDCYKTFVEYNELRKRYPLAIEYMRKYQALKDSVSKQDNIAMVAEMESVYKAEKAERENALLMKDIEREKTQQNYIVVIAFLIIVLMLFTYSRYYSKKNANRKLLELNTVKDKLFRIIAHDLKNPFGVILGFTEILANDYNELSDHERIELITDIDKASKQTYKLLENLLYWSNTQIGGLEYSPTQFDLLDTIKQTFMLYDSIAKNKNIELATDLNQNLNVFCDQDMIRTVLRNLVFNGIKFSNNGGKVIVRVNQNDVETKVAVEDTGIGISEDKLKKLFTLDNISSTDGTAAEKGTGLGLILCKELVHKNGGEITVTSKENKGSSFVFTIPNKN
jgi:signal transduction histidine kinase/Tfp pilus assembly protein PilF